MLSLMTITRERQSDIAEWKDRRGRDPCSGERSHERVWYFHREYAGGSSLKPPSDEGGGAAKP